MLALAVHVYPFVSNAQSVTCDENMKHEIRQGYAINQAVLKLQYDFLGELIAEVAAKSAAPKTYVSLGQPEDLKTPPVNSEVQEILSLLKKRWLALGECVALIERGR